jgi:hypothetical protein
MSSPHIDNTQETLLPLILALIPAGASLIIGDNAAELAKDAFIICVLPYLMFKLSDSLWRSAVESARQRQISATPLRSRLRDLRTSSTASSANDADAFDGIAETAAVGASPTATLWYLSMPVWGATTLYYAREHFTGGTKFVTDFNIMLYMALELIKNVKKLDSLKQVDGPHVATSHIETVLREIRRENRIVRRNLATLAQKYHEGRLQADIELNALRQEVARLSERVREQRQEERTRKSSRFKKPQTMLPNGDTAEKKHGQMHLDDFCDLTTRHHMRAPPLATPTVVDSYDGVSTSTPRNNRNDTTKTRLTIVHEDPENESESTPALAHLSENGGSRAAPKTRTGIEQLPALRYRPPLSSSRGPTNGHRLPANKIPTATTRLPRRSSSRLEIPFLLIQTGIKLAWFFCSLPTRMIRYILVVEYHDD